LCYLAATFVSGLVLAVSIAAVTTLGHEVGAFRQDNAEAIWPWLFAGAVFLLLVLWLWWAHRINMRFLREVGAEPTGWLHILFLAVTLALPWFGPMIVMFAFSRAEDRRRAMAKRKADG
jgi:hypothetical protein